ncbi:MAG: L-histidine N(alpha)-methyltransferase [Deltaproteobacteria bacterium]|nr:L-histidine N(alpha)-methyltransferase [Deltaproteobacteria bacterium]
MNHPTLSAIEDFLQESITEINNRPKGPYGINGVADLAAGLTARQRYIPCKYFYDAQGSRLFEAICRLPEYYPTRTEMGLLKEVAPGLAGTLNHKDLVELGSGADRKIGILLRATTQDTRSTLRYIPVDISDSAVLNSSLNLKTRFPELKVKGLVADFTSQLKPLPTDRPTMFLFLGSTIGNFDDVESVVFLRNMAAVMKPEDTMLIGFDMLKPLPLIEAAYNDTRGVTAAFNKNILRAVNKELQALFDPSCFDHLAFFNENHSRIEMHLKANQDVAVRIDALNMTLEIKEGETLHTENSRKFTRESIEWMAGLAGLTIHDWRQDSSGWFSLVSMGL